MGLPVVILGGGGHARVVADACLAGGREVRGFLDPNSTVETEVDSLPVLGGDELLDHADFVTRHDFVVAIGDQKLRPRLAGEVKEKGGRLTIVVHPGAIVARGVHVGAGTVIFAGAVINPGSVLGENVIVNTGATIDHDCTIEDGVHICPGVNLAGGVTCRTGAMVGTGAAVIPSCTIGRDALVGAGSSVISDVPDGTTVIGCPARPRQSKNAASPSSRPREAGDRD